MENCFSESMKSLLRGGTGDEQQPDEGVDVGTVGRNRDPNLDLLKAVLALPEKIHEQMETFEVGIAVGEIMAVLKLVGYYFLRFSSLFLNDCINQANKTLTDIAPWSPDATPGLIHTTRIIALETIRIVGACIEPIMPTVSGMLRDALGVDSLVLKDEDGIKIEQDQAEVLWERWSGRKINGVRLF